MIHINLNMILDAHLERSPTKRVDMKHYTKKQTTYKHTLQASLSVHLFIFDSSWSLQCFHHCLALSLGQVVDALR